MKTIINKILLAFGYEIKKPSYLLLYMNSVTNESWLDGMCRNGQVVKYRANK